MSGHPVSPFLRGRGHSAIKRARQALFALSGKLPRKGFARSFRTQLGILHAQQEATPDGILVVGLDGRVLSYNRRFLEVWRIPPEVAARRKDEELLQHAARQVANWDAFIATVNHLYAHPEEIATDDPIPLKDGRILRRSSLPIRAGGKVLGRAWYFRDVTDQERSEVLQSALFRIAQLSREAQDLNEFYAALHRVVEHLMHAPNFYIAELDSERNILTFPYFVDQFDPAPEGRPPGGGLTAYVLRTGQPLLANPEKFAELQRRGEVRSIGAPSVDWMGVPLKSGDRTWGVIGIQSYDAGTRYTEHELEILLFVAQHVASAIEQKRKEEAIRGSERRYRQMFENNRAVQLLIDPNSGMIVDGNMAACDFYGYTLDELRSMRVWDINVMDAATIRAEMDNAARQERSYFVFRHMLANGELRDVEVHSGPVDIGDQTVLYSIIHDITERKRAEQALQQSEEKYRNIFDFASVGIYQSTPEGAIVTANPALARMLGYDSVEELLTRNLSRDVYFRTGERDDLVRQYTDAEVPANLEILWKKKDGKRIWVQLNAHSLSTPRGARYFEGFVVDITERKRAEERLAAANLLRKAVLDAATRVSIIATDRDGAISVFNAGAERMLGYAADEMIGRENMLHLHRASELAQHSAILSAEFRRPIGGFEVLVLRAAEYGVEEREWTYIKKDGTMITVLVSVTSIRSDDGKITGFLHVGTDVTERKAAEETLRRQSAAMTASMDGIGIVNERLEFTYANDALAKLFGYPAPSSLIGASFCDLYDPPEQVRFVTAVVPLVGQRGRWRGEATGLRRDGTWFPQEISLTAIEGGAMVAVVRDITERTYAEEQIKHLAYHDALTGLPNRLLFKDRLTVALSHAQRSGSRLAVLFLDLDRFKVINDSLGHNVGDQLLQAVAARLQTCLRDSDTVARLGGDEFTLLLPNLSRSDDAAPIADKILEALRAPIHIEGRELYTSTSIGISLYPEDGSDAETLIKNADTAMYQAKEQGRDNYQLFNAFVNARALQRIALEHGLRRALPNDELAVHYQPIFDLRSKRITGMEALLRWNHPELGSIAPSIFIPLAESTGGMVPIGAWVLQTACRQAKEWHDAGFADLSLAVNLSVTQLQHPDLVRHVAQVLKETGLPPEMLELEITESSAMQSPEASIRTLFELKQLGIRVSLDDFGTGHSSLSYLKRFPIDTLKVDQSFVRDIGSDPDTAAIVTAIIAMAHSLRLKVIAEGVETTEQADFLRTYGCDQMQGFLIKEPVAAHEFAGLLTQPA